MKKGLLFFTICIAALTSRAQWSTNGTGIIYYVGNVGINTSAPLGPLQVSGGTTYLQGLNVGFGASIGVITTDAAVKPISFQLGGTEYARLSPNGNPANFEIKNPVSGALGPVLRLTGGGGSGAQAAIDLASYDPGSNAPAGRIAVTDDGNFGGSINFLSKTPGAITNPLTARLTIMDNGNVGIGTTDTKGYLLGVNGSAIFTSAWVKPYANWPDYVFQKGYTLPSLDSVAEYIQKNRHLPDIPSADSIQLKGIDLGGTQTALLKKIEELTLYAIEQDQAINALKENQQQLQKQNQLLIERLGLLEKKLSTIPSANPKP
jgi:hypothetical protein